MRGGALPPALLCAALGLALAFAPPRVWAPALLTLAAAAVGASLVPFPASAADALFFGCWASLLAAAALVHLRQGLGSRACLLLAANAGVWSGAVIAVSGRPLDLAIALPCALFVFAGRFRQRVAARLGLKVLASWLAAVAVLAAGLSLSPTTPGYEPDHME